MQGTGASSKPASDKAGGDDADEDADVDVLTRDAADARFLSSDEEDELPDQLHHLQVSLCVCVLIPAAVGTSAVLYDW